MIDKEDFIWEIGQEPSEYRYIRIPRPGDMKARQIGAIPVQELQNAILQTLHKWGRMKYNAIQRAVAQQFGIRRLGSSVRERLDQALNELASKGECSISDEFVAPR